jgi:nicotinate-nucleotide pyrophosphorylase (carboxylating)
MIKDIHRELANLEGPGGIRRAVQACRAMWPALDVEVEADTMDDLRAALEAEADIVLLDNMSDEEMRHAVRLTNGRALLEASGGIGLDRVRSAAATGVDFISVGALTHSVRAIDISLDVRLRNQSSR